jgi:hypothetical protein
MAISMANHRNLIDEEYFILCFLQNHFKLHRCKMKKYSFICISYFSLKAAIEEISLQGSYCSDFQNLLIGFAFRLLH